MAQPLLTTSIVTTMVKVNAVHTGVVVRGSVEFLLLPMSPPLFPHQPEQAFLKHVCLNVISRLKVPRWPPISVRKKEQNSYNGLKDST